MKKTIKLCILKMVGQYGDNYSLVINVGCKEEGKEWENLKTYIHLTNNQVNNLLAYNIPIVDLTNKGGE